ncbi:diguanylate cyclase [Halieaceae bacterium IMCC11814]|uniref:Diguanylate cyclase n=1 Tax=Candidatus Marimicrobium litorale TaxID=2518991 RepID=A0ABT3T120_9GAMM|nr:diguanylate cyclase [Candidatus Marimicrobium litorale]
MEDSSVSGLALLQSRLPLEVSRCGCTIAARLNRRFNYFAILIHRVPQNIAEQSLALSRDSDIGSRIGGEEFAHLLIETDLEDAGTIAQRSLAGKSKAEIDGQSVTVSVGVVRLLESDKRFKSF